jgi:hypothetical protein
MLGAVVRGARERAWPGVRAPYFALLLAVAGCASQSQGEPRDVADANDTGRSLPAQTRLEQDVLLALPSLESGRSRPVGNAVVVAEQAYTAASGRTCRALSIGVGGKNLARLACHSGGTWYFVPDVFGQVELGR